MTLRRRFLGMAELMNRTKVVNLIPATLMAGNHMIHFIGTGGAAQITHIRAAQHAAANLIPPSRHTG
jgi:hypothetical protein